MELLAFAKGTKVKPDVSGEVTVDDEWWEDEPCSVIVKKLTKLKATEQKCKRENTSCWVFLQKMLPIYINHYEKEKAKKGCKE